MKLAIAANRKVDPKAVAVHLAAALIMAYEEDNTSVILVRASASMVPASSVERLAINIATELGLSHTYYPPATIAGRSGVYHRDYEMAMAADRVLAFFSYQNVMVGGTGHVVHAALQKGVPVEAWELEADGTLTSVGSDEGYNINSEDVEWLGHIWEVRKLLAYQENLYGGLAISAISYEMRVMDLATTNIVFEDGTTQTLKGFLNFDTSFPPSLSQNSTEPPSG